jgi:hypothetical protein
MQSATRPLHDRELCNAKTAILGSPFKTHDELYDDQIGGELLFASRARGQVAWSPVKLVKYDRRVGRGRLKV